jgi:hypothetical protein
MQSLTSPQRFFLNNATLSSEELTLYNSIACSSYPKYDVKVQNTLNKLIERETMVSSINHKTTLKPFGNVPKPTIGIGRAQKMML